MKRKILFFIILSNLLIPLFFLYFFYSSKASPIKADITIDTKKTMGNFPDHFKAFTQTSEEKRVKMSQNTIDFVTNLYPKYIRIDHIYDAYDVVIVNNQGNIVLNWQKLDEIICDIYNVGAKPFLVLGYMPKFISEDGTITGKPKKWEDWSFLVQKTIERYSGKNTILPCGLLSEFWKTNLYYEVWNEPDLETFGKWYYTGKKNYNELYFLQKREQKKQKTSILLRLVTQQKPLHTKIGLKNS